MINPLVRSIGLKLRLTILFIIFIFASGCSQFAFLASVGSISISQNAYVKFYNGMDVLTLMSTEKSLKQHAYDKGKKYIYKVGDILGKNIIRGTYDETRVQTLAVIEEKYP